MSILNFQKPDKIVMQKANDFEGLFEFKPLEPGFGQTIGNSLRRVLLFAGGFRYFRSPHRRCRPRIFNDPWRGAGRSGYYP